MNATTGFVIVTNTEARRNATVLIIAASASLGCWIITLRQMAGMNMGVATKTGNFGHFILLWSIMMAAMMLPGAVPAAFHRARASESVRGALLFLTTYVGVWAALGAAVYLLYRPHGYLAAGAMVVAAGVYELTPAKRVFRQRCCRKDSSGIEFALSCAGSSGGLMLIQIALGLMSILWMVVITLVIFAQKVLSPRPAVDTSLALGVVGFGLLVAVAPSSLPGFLLSM